MPAGTRDRAQLDLGSQNCLSLTAAQRTDKLATQLALRRLAENPQPLSSDPFDSTAMSRASPLRTAIGYDIATRQN
jgi:hypothetical protein